MNVSELKKFVLREDACDREKKYCEFYGRIIKSSVVFTEDLMSKVKAVLHCEKEISAIKDHPDSCYQLAYMLQFGVHDSCLTVQKFYESVMEYSEIVETLTWKNRIRICCMGSESLFATIGICKVIEEANVQFGFLSDAPTEVQVLVVDKERSWKRLCKQIVAAANSYYSNVVLKLDYSVADLTENVSDEVILKINKSHMVIMSRFLSQFCRLKKVLALVKKILHNMKIRAILFYLDDCDKGHHEVLKQSISEKDSFSEIRSSEERYASPVKLRSEEYCLDFPFTWNTNFQPVISSTWIKYPGIKVKTPEKMNVPGPAAQTIQSIRKQQKKESSTRLHLRNSNETIRLDGKFAYKDLEKKNKSDKHRQKAKEAYGSRYASFEDD